jgi:hypothetical protein
LDQAIGLWNDAFPLLSRFSTASINPSTIQATLQQIRTSIQETRTNLVGRGHHAGTLDPWELTNVRVVVNATLGSRVLDVIAAEDQARGRRALIGSGVAIAASIALLFLPGGAFIDFAIGAAMVADSWEHARELGHAANTHPDADRGLVTQSQADWARFSAALGTVFLVVGTAAQGLRILQRWRSAAILSEGASSAAVPAQAARSARSFFLGPSRTPTQAEMDDLLQQAWRLLRGDPARIPSVRVDPTLGADTAGVFRSWVGTRGNIANTVFHEAMHARLRQWFPVLSEHLMTNPNLRTALRHMDEVVAYAFGAYGRVTRGGAVSDRLLGVMEGLMSPWLAYGSANSVAEAIPGIVRDMLLVTMYIYALVRLVEEADERR